MIGRTVTPDVEASDANDKMKHRHADHEISVMVSVPGEFSRKPAHTLRPHDLEVVTMMRKIAKEEVDPVMISS